MIAARIFIFAALSFLINIQFCFGQRAASAVKTHYFDYSDSTNKILPAADEEFKVDVRILSDNLLEKYKNDPEFNYDNKSKESEDWITKIKNWINQQLAIIRSSKTYSTLLDYFYYSLMIIALILIIRGLIKADRRGFLFGKDVNNEMKIVELQEDINQLDFDELITNALEKKQYKLAVRYLFLKSLKLLSERGLLELKHNKTNHQYLSEIKSDQIAGAFRNTTFRFEWIWYGDFQVDEEIMKNSLNDFNSLFGMIKS